MLFWLLSGSCNCLSVITHIVAIPNIVIFRAVALDIRFLLYQLLHNNSFYSYMFRLTTVAIIRELLFIEVRSIQYVNEW
jgi:hypothetical protein